MADKPLQNYFKVLIFIFSVFVSWTNAICCGNDLGNECFDPHKKIEPQCLLPVFKLYTRKNREETAGIEISVVNAIPDTFDGSKKTVFTIHGFQGSTTDAWVGSLTDALLQKGDFNIIEVDWSSHTKIYVWQYAQASVNTRVCGKAVADLFTLLIEEQGLAREDGHCIGHSLGAHVCGYSGKYKQWGRISALDPAGPEFRSLAAADRLNKEDADFVDVIHTDGGDTDTLAIVSDSLGLLENIGHVDFYPNGGKNQPGCILNKRKLISIEKKIALDEDELEINRLVDRGITDQIACSHGRATFLYINSVNSDCFQATEKCTDYNYIVVSMWAFWSKSSSCKPCTRNCHQEMGYNSINYKQNQGIFYLETTSTAPYCRRTESSQKGK